MQEGTAHAHAEAHVPTERAGRYLDQVCRHAGLMGGMRHQPSIHRRGGQAPPTVEHADRSGTLGTIRFADGTCALEATTDALAVRVEAADDEALQRLKDGIARRLETIGRRDHLAVQWDRPEAAPDSPADSSVPGTPSKKRRHDRLIALGWLTVVAVAIVTHVGLLASALSISTWGRWAISALVVIVLVKVVVIGVHLAGRRGKVSTRRRKLTNSLSAHARAESRSIGPER